MNVSNWVDHISRVFKHHNLKLRRGYARDLRRQITGYSKLLSQACGRLRGLSSKIDALENVANNPQAIYEEIVQIAKEYRATPKKYKTHKISFLYALDQVEHMQSRLDTLTGIIIDIFAQYRISIFMS